VTDGERLALRHPSALHRSVLVSSTALELPVASTPTAHTRRRIGEIPIVGPKTTATKAAISSAISSAITITAPSRS